MNFMPATSVRRHAECTVFRSVLSTATFFYSDAPFLSNGVQGQVVHGSPAHAAKKAGLLRHARLVERCHLCLLVSSRVYPRAESVHRFKRLAGFERGGRCRKATTKPTYGRGCVQAAVFCKPSLSYGPQVQVLERWTQNTCATSVQIGGAATRSCKWLGTNTTRFTWVPAWGGSFGCSIEGSTTTGRSSSTTLVAKTCNALPACGPLIVGALPQRKADRPAPHLPNRRGNGRCATLPRQQRTRTRKQSRPAPARRAVA